ncbi:flavodoxin domain-containing protein [Conexibacter sp. CPCC 206217]|uniref:flavodoxin domain-containing protein n=1 Tax=Conexibacter sp. CPCC 206217 TaxID=3064574 RepID=UPI002724D50B|nr:flavodoxin domain-containing protein [Conexibacter sp. CPCC 206217]MDO8210271.1 flavodoxin domain-containing protein [Conexibacter sp. CPCC 206217]
MDAPITAAHDDARSPVLVAYATKHGHTRLIAERVGAVLRESGLEIDLCDLGARHADARPAAYSGVVVAASVHAGRHQASVERWAKSHTNTLATRPTAFLSVSLTAADDTDEALATTSRMIEDLREKTGWNPTRTLAVAGALLYREYDIATRVLMRLISRQHGAPTDVSRDFDFTDWAAVEQFAREFAALVAAPAAQPA